MTHLFSIPLTSPVSLVYTPLGSLRQQFTLCTILINQVLSKIFKHSQSSSIFGVLRKNSFPGLLSCEAGRRVADR